MIDTADRVRCAAGRLGRWPRLAALLLLCYSLYAGAALAPRGPARRRLEGTLWRSQFALRAQDLRPPGH